MVEEAVDVVKFAALLSSPTVSGGL